MKMTALKKNIAENNKLWILVWILFVLNVTAMFIIAYEISLLMVFLLIFIALFGFLYIKSLANFKREEERYELEKEVNNDVESLMQKIMPVCDDVFLTETKMITEPVIAAVREDFSNNLSWLWEDGDFLSHRLREGIQEIEFFIQLINALNNDSLKYAKKLEDSRNVLLQAIDDIEMMRENDDEALKIFLKEREENLMKSLEKEKIIFYDYVQKILLSRMLNSEEDNSNLIDYFNVNKLAEQFSVVIEKSIQARLDNFEGMIIINLEDFSAGIVGKIQKSTLHVVTELKHIEEIADIFIDDFREKKGKQGKELIDCKEKIIQLREEVNDMMLTLAWQDILIEKRWQGVEKKLVYVKESVKENVGEDVLDYMDELMDKEVMDFKHRSEKMGLTTVYNALLGSELVYQIYESQSLLDIIEDGVYSLLQYIIPVNLMVCRVVNFGESDKRRLKNIRNDIKNDKNQAVFNRVYQMVKDYQADCTTYIDNLYPQSFNGFCNNPYLQHKPENLQQAAWMLYVSLLDEEDLEDDAYLLPGLLLCMHELRNRYIHPLKSQPVLIKDYREIVLMRSICYKCINIIIEML